MVMAVTERGSYFFRKNEEMVYSYALDLMKMGYTVYIPDLLGSGERRLGVYDDIQKSDCDELNFAINQFRNVITGYYCL